jgi:hypothetical protein
MQPQTMNAKRRWGMALAGLLLAIGISTLSAPSILRAQGSAGPSLQGTWLATATPSSLETCLAGGDVLEETNSPNSISLGHGAWVKTGERQFTAEFVKFRFDAPATRIFIGTLRITQKIELDTAGTTFHSASTIQRFDADGNPKEPPGSFTQTGTRLYATGASLPVTSP